MKLSVRVQYGLQALIELASHYGDLPVQISEIAKKQKLPIRYLEQLLLVLKRQGLLKSTRGKEGGYLLAKKPEKISLLDIVRVFEGEIELTNKKMKKTLVIFETFDKIQKNIETNLKQITLDDMLYRRKQLERTYTYNI